MKLTEVTEPGFYTDNLETRETIFEVMLNGDEQWLKEEPEDILIVDTWNHSYTDLNSRRHYEVDGLLTSVKCAPDIEVYKIEDTKYTDPDGPSGSQMREDKKTYKEKFFKLLEGDKGTLDALREFLVMVESNGQTCGYLRKIIKDFERDIEEICNE